MTYPTRFLQMEPDGMITPSTDLKSKMGFWERKSGNSTICEKCMLNRFSRVRLFATLGTVAHQAPLSMGFSRQEYWSGLPCPSPGDLPDPGIEPTSPALKADTLTSEPPGKPLLSQ